MKKIIFCILSAIILFSASIAYAHPPQDIILTYDPATKTLTALIKHNVSNPETHYIKKVDIGLNNKEVATLKFTHQDNNLTQTAVYTLKDARPGDSLSVEAYCSISGKLKKEIKVK